MTTYEPCKFRQDYRNYFIQIYQGNQHPLTFKQLTNVVNFKLDAKIHRTESMANSCVQIL